MILRGGSSALDALQSVCLLDLRRRLKAVMDVLDAMIRNDRSLDLPFQWEYS